MLVGSQRHQSWPAALVQHSASRNGSLGVSYSSCDYAKTMFILILPILDNLSVKVLTVIGTLGRFVYND